MLSEDYEVTLIFISQGFQTMNFYSAMAALKHLLLGSEQGHLSWTSWPRSPRLMQQASPQSSDPMHQQRLWLIALASLRIVGSIQKQNFMAIS